MTTIDRVALLAEAQAIEAGGGQWNALHVGAVLGMARKSVYDTAWLRRIAKPAGRGRYRWIPAEVRRQQEIESKHVRRRLRPTGS